MNQKFSANILVTGPGSPKDLRIICDFLADLRSQQFASSTVEPCRAVAQSCAAWMAGQGLSLQSLDEAAIEEFLHRRLPRGLPRPAPSTMQRYRRTLGALLSFLRQHRLAKPRASKPPNAADQLISRYDQHLQQVGGLADQTRRVRRHYAREFLTATFGQRRIVPRKLVPRHIGRFIGQRANEIQTSSLRVLATSLRSFLEFLHVTGLAHERLIRAVACPAPALRNPLPQALSEAQLRAFLRGFDRHQPLGQRDFAMALCLCRLGLRAQEVASLELQDLNWHNQTLHLRRTKSRRERVLPLPSEVAQALTQYLRDGRPGTSTRLVFARHQVPGRASQGVHLVRSAMRRAFL